MIQFLSGQLESALAKRFDVDYKAGACVNSEGSPVTSGKYFLSNAADHRICFVMCHEARNDYMSGCEFDPDTKTCYSHTDDLEHGSTTLQPNSECMTFLARSEEAGVCELYSPNGSHRPDFVFTISGNGTRTDMGEVETEKECVAKCFADKAAKGCEFKRMTPDSTSGHCQAINVVFKGGSGPTKKTLSCIRPCTSVCWRFRTVPGFETQRKGRKAKRKQRERKGKKGQRRGGKKKGNTNPKKNKERKSKNRGNKKRKSKNGRNKQRESKKRGNKKRKSINRRNENRRNKSWNKSKSSSQ